MPSSAGWLCAFFSLLLGGLGYFFGGIELLIPALAGLSALGFALIIRYVRSSRLTVSRSISPSLLPAGQVTEVQVTLNNTGLLRSPPGFFFDSIQETDGYFTPISPLARKGGEATLQYRINAERRGAYRIGPSSIFEHDPLGLVERKFRVPNIAQLLVHPRLEPLSSFSLSSLGDAWVRDHRNTPGGTTHDDFEGLRPYVPGDDLRQVHWLTSARQDELLVRQTVPPKDDLLCIVIDTSLPVHSASALDVTTSIAGSLAAAVLSADQVVQMTTSLATNPQVFRGATQINAMLEFLVFVSGSEETQTPLSAGLEGKVIAISADPTLFGDVEAQVSFAGRFGAHMLITCDAENWGLADNSQRYSDWIHLSTPNQMANLLRANLVPSR